MIDITKTRNNYTKFPTTLKQKCEPVLLVQQKHQQKNQLKQSTTSKTVAPTAKKQSSSIYSELKPALTVKQIGGNFSGRTIGIGRGVPIATRIETAQRILPPTTTSTAVTNSSSAANAVRKANQQFFLIPDFQDKNFLKDECAIAHAQVATPPSVTPQLGKRTVATKNVTRRSTVTKDSTESKDAVGVKQSSNYNNINNNNNNTLPSLQQQDTTRLSVSKANVTNVMRRSAGVGSGCGYGNTLDSTTTTTKAGTKIGSAPISGSTATTSSTSAPTPHRVEIQFNGVESSVHPKSAPHTTATTKSSLSSLSSLPNNVSSSSNAVAGKGNNVVSNKATVKPLVHRSIATVTTSANIRTAAGENLAYTNSVNNNGDNGQQVNQSNSNNNHLTNPSNSNNNNGHTANNNSMAAPTSGVATLDHDDIKYIDSDENTGMTPPASLNAGNVTAINSNIGKFVECVEPPIPTLINKPTTFTSGTRMRPKSTIVCSNNHNVFEKINTYKYANGTATTSAGATEAVYSTTTTGSRRQLNTSIDSNSIKASIEKFNTYSEQKRLPLANAVTLRAHSGATGSTSNLQYHRHSGSDFDSGNLRQLTNSNGSSGGGSLTRNPYRASSALTSNIGSVSQNAPLKAKVRLSDATVTASTATTTYKTINKITDDRRIQSTATTATGGAATETMITVGEESIRSASTKSALPPASPTASRYWDRESNRTSSLSTLSSSHNHIDAVKSSDEKSEGLCGLRNIGNTCFMNSIIQCLSHTNELTKFLRNYSGMRSSTTTKDQQILQEFAKLIREMWTSNVHSVTPMDLKRAFSSKHRMYSDYNQQDAQEFLRFFLDSLHSALNSGVKGEPLKIDDNLSDNKKAELTWEWYTRHENSLIRDLFVGQLKSTLRCTTCGNTSVTFDPFWDLSVSLPSSSRCKLDACLELFIREEVLDGDEMPTCSKCKTRRKCTKSFSIQRFPKYLVIHLKRFSETRWSKLSNIVEFPTGERELNMGPYGANANTNMYYSLYAISNHMGSTAGGHYVALCKHPVSREWHEFNDNIVSEPLSENHLVSSSAYILFYERA